jgi:DNA-binding transcriptional MerR regulator
LAEYRIDELAGLSGVSARNIRAYRERGLLDPPRRVGRSALYDDVHLSQLTTINDLLRRGFSSAHIADFFASVRNGHDLADLLGLQAAIFGDRRRPTAVPVPVDLDDADARRLRELGMADVVDGELRFADREIAEVVGRSGEPVECVRAMLRAADAVGLAVDDLAAAKVQALVGSILARFGANFVPRPEEMGEWNLAVADYGDLVDRVAADLLQAAVERHLAAANAGYALAVTPWWWRDRRRTAARATPG